jgi:FkbM family methyltransferase
MEEYSEYQREHIVDRPSPLHSLGLYFLRHELRGGHRLMSLLLSAGLVRPVRWQLPGGIPIVAPVSRVEQWDLASLVRYGQVDACAMAGVIGTDAYAVIDCGADFGQIPLQLMSMGCKFTDLIAFEPNPKSFPWCKHNLEAYGRVFDYAVSNFTGKARLSAPADDDSPQARFIEAADDGEISVVKVDDFDLTGDNILLKLDIEGAELAALQGSQRTLARARKLLVCFEAHQAVEKRVGISSLEVMKYLESIRPMAFCIPGTKELTIKMPTAMSADEVSRTMERDHIRTANILAWSISPVA